MNGLTDLGYVVKLEIFDVINAYADDKNAIRNPLLCLKDAEALLRLYDTATKNAKGAKNHTFNWTVHPLTNDLPPWAK